MAAPGHDDLKQAELHSEEADREMMARAMIKVTAMIMTVTDNRPLEAYPVDSGCFLARFVPP